MPYRLMYSKPQNVLKSLSYISENFDKTQNFTDLGKLTQNTQSDST